MVVAMLSNEAINVTNVTCLIFVLEEVLSAVFVFAVEDDVVDLDEDVDIADWADEIGDMIDITDAIVIAIFDGELVSTEYGD